MLSFLAVPASQTNVYSQVLSTRITSLGQLRALDQAEVQKKHPVNVTGTVLYCNQESPRYCYLRDDTGGAYIEEPPMPIAAGDSIAVEGYVDSLPWGGWPGIGPNARIELKGKGYRPPPLGSVEAIKRLSASNAFKGHALDVEGVITFCGHPITRKPFCFLQDGDHGIYLNSLTTIPNAGDRVRVRGITEAGWFAPNIGPGMTITFIKKGALPDPSNHPIQYLLSGQEDGRWVSLSGQIRSAELIDDLHHNGLRLTLSSGQHDEIELMINHHRVPERLIGAYVRVEGVASGVFNGNRQLTGIRIYLPHMDNLTFTQPGYSDVFAEIPPTPTNNLLSFYLEQDVFTGLHHIQGTITMAHPEGYYILQDSAGTALINTKEQLSIHDSVHVIGFPSADNLVPVLNDALIRSHGKATRPSTILSFSPDSLQKDNIHAKLVQISGKVLNIMEDNEHAKYKMLSNGYYFNVLLSDLSTRPYIRAGSDLEVTGVIELNFNPAYEPTPKIDPFVIHARNHADIRLIQQGPWWTPSHTRWFFIGLVICLLFIASWVTLLKKQIREQTREIRKKNDSLENANKEIQHKSISLEVAYEEAQTINNDLIQTNKMLESRTTQLRDALEKNKEILGITAHDLKNPLGGIIGLSDMVIEDIEAGIQATYQSAVDHIPLLKQEAERMLQIITHLLDKHREGEEVTLNKERTILGDIVSAVIRWNKKQARDKGMKIHFHLDENVILDIDVLAIERVLDNYVSNAVKYSPPGSNIWITIYTCRAVQEEEVSFVRVSVKDEGPGLSDEDKQKVFGKMQRLSAKPTGGEHSTGLGLFIVKQLVEAHGGTVGVDSVQGEGATFWYTLPIPEPAELMAELIEPEMAQ